MDRWNPEKFITTGTVIAGVIALFLKILPGFSATLGSGFLVELLTQPSLHTQEQQFSTDSTTLTICEIENTGKGTAKNISVILWTESNVLFDEDVTLIDPEQLLELKDGGHVGDTSVRAERSRLSGTQKISIVAKTSTLAEYECEASSEGGLIIAKDEPLLNLTIFDYILLFTIQTSIIFLLIWVWTNNTSNEQVLEK